MIYCYIAEEGGNGKDALLAKGAYDEMDICLMQVVLWTYAYGLPDLNLLKVSSCPRATLICELKQLTCPSAHRCRVFRSYVRPVTFSVAVAIHLYILPCFSAHAALSPWEGQNALDAAVLAYTNISLLRQQVKPSHRIHGVFHGKDWTPNSTHSTCILSFTPGSSGCLFIHFFFSVIPDYAKMSYVQYFFAVWINTCISWSFRQLGRAGTYTR